MDALTMERMVNASDMCPTGFEGQVAAAAEHLLPEHSHKLIGKEYAKQFFDHSYKMTLVEHPKVGAEWKTFHQLMEHHSQGLLDGYTHVTSSNEETEIAFDLCQVTASLLASAFPQTMACIETAWQDAFARGVLEAWPEPRRFTVPLGTAVELLEKSRVEASSDIDGHYAKAAIARALKTAWRAAKHDNFGLAYQVLDEGFIYPTLEHYFGKKPIFHLMNGLEVAARKASGTDGDLVDPLEQALRAQAASTPIQGKKSITRTLMAFRASWNKLRNVSAYSRVLPSDFIQVLETSASSVGEQS